MNGKMVILLVLFIVIVSTFPSLPSSGQPSTGSAQTPYSDAPSSSLSNTVTLSTSVTYWKNVSIPNSNTVSGTIAPATAPVMASNITSLTSISGTYKVTFDESGLKTGVRWYVNITSVVSLSSTSTSTYTDLANGSYTYKLATNSEYFIPSSSSGSFTVDGAPITISVDFEELYVATFSESGLASGTWYINVSTTSQAFSEPYSTTSLSFLEPNNTYSYTAATNYKIDKPSPSSGSFTVSGANVSESITFTEVTYTITFSESGLASGTWWVNVTTTSQSFSEPSSTSSISFSEPNGTYSYTVQTNYKIDEPSPSSGSFTVNGASTSVSVSFTEVTYTVTFTESGLPSGTSWSVTLNGYEQSSTSTTISFTETNGTYSFTVTQITDYSASPSSGSITVNGAAVSQSITFTLVQYVVTFSESGLPSGTWYVNITTTGQSFSEPSSTTSFSFSESNGTYSYTVATGNKFYSPSPSSGSFTVNGASTSVSVSFTEVTYTVTFTESGLASGTWWVNITTTGQSFSEPSSTTSFSFQEPNATYSYTVQTNYKIDKPSPSSGSFTVNGGTISVSITFSEVTYTVTFTESGLPSGTSWSVTLNSYEQSSTSTTI
ncbi:MAG: DUF5979 domain-containing protein, partial [Candidatus Parvarchaeota archaeon]